MRTAPTETRADMQRYFGIDVKRADPFLCAACAACLPLGSVAMARLIPEYSFTAQDYMLHSVLCAFAGIRIPFPWEHSANGIGEVRLMDIEEYDAWANQKWKEVE